MNNWQIKSGMTALIHHGPHAGKAGILKGRWTYPFHWWVIQLKGEGIETAVSVPPTSFHIIPPFVENPRPIPGHRSQPCT